jgi:hypothetical protein
MDSNFSKQILFTDYSLERRTTAEGEVKRYYNENALAQAIKVWLASGRGEKTRTVGAGWVMPFIGKALSKENAESLRQNIVLGLTTDFSPALTITSCIVIPNVEKNIWIINVQGYNSNFNIGVNTNILLKNS